MKKTILLLFGGVFLLTSPLFAGKTIEEEPVADVREEPRTVSISTSVWTRIPPSSVGNWDKRNGISVNDMSTNNANFGFILSTGTNTPGTAITVFTHEISPAGPDREFLIGTAIILWGISLHTSSETAVYHEFKQ